MTPAKLKDFAAAARQVREDLPEADKKALRQAMADALKKFSDHAKSWFPHDGGAWSVDQTRRAGTLGPAAQGVQQLATNISKSFVDIANRTRRRAYLSSLHARDKILSAYSAAPIEKAKESLLIAGRKVTIYKEGDSPGHPFRGNQYTTGTNTPEFKAWFGDSKVVDEEGKPLRVFHGTTHDLSQFDTSPANPEAHWGAGIYFTDSPSDASENYARVGPDLTNRIELRAEELMGSADLDQDAAQEQARKELIGKANGVVVPAYLSMQTPFVVGGGEDTFLDFNQNYNEQEDSYEEPTGKLVDFANALRDAASNFSDVENIEDVIGAIYEKSLDYDGISASDLDNVWRSHEGTFNISDDDGKMVREELFRRALQGAGFDGIIDHAAGQKFGPGRKTGKAMAGMSEDTTHLIVFKPEQIKSVFNRGTWDSKSPKLSESISILGRHFEVKRNATAMPEPLEPKRDGKRRLVARALITEPDGRVWLYDPHDEPYIGFPGGGVNPGETMQAAALRECREETGLVVELTAYLGDFADQFSTRRYYLARRVGGEPTTRDEDGNIPVRVRAVSKGRAAELLTSEFDRCALALATKRMQEGDIPGHEFHGNQYTDASASGEGRAGDLRAAIERRKAAKDALAAVGASPEEVQKILSTVGYYQAGSAEINEELARANGDAKALEEKTRTRVARIDKFLNAMPKYAKAVFRGADLDQEALATFRPGEVIQFHSYTSTSMSPTVADEFKDRGKPGTFPVLFAIEDHRGVELPSADEREVLLPRESKFKVIAKGQVDGVWKISLRGVNQMREGDEVGHPFRGNQYVDVAGEAETKSPAFKKWFSGSKVVDDAGQPLVVYHGTDAEDFAEFRPGAFFSTNPDEASAYSKTGELKARMKGEAKYKIVDAPKSLIGSRVPYRGTLADFEGQVKAGTVVATDNGVFKRRDGGWDAYGNIDVEYGTSDFDDESIRLRSGDGSAARKMVLEYRKQISHDFSGGDNGRVYPVYLSIKNPVRLDPFQANLLGLRLGASRQSIAAKIAEYEAQGYDGIITQSDEASAFPEAHDALGHIPTHYIAFRPEQVKSKFNRGTWNPNSPKLSEGEIGGEWRDAFERVLEGDSPGHPFRGNQFTDGESSGGEWKDGIQGSPFKPISISTEKIGNDPELANFALGHAGYVDPDTHEIVGVHLTDDPSHVINAIEAGDVVEKGRRESSGFGDIGPGVYMSNAPQLWTGRSTDKWGFAGTLDDKERKAVAEALNKKLNDARATRYISNSEYESGVRSVKQFRDGFNDPAMDLAAQPYNIAWWKPDFLEPLGVQASKPPQEVEMRVRGKLINIEAAPQLRNFTPEDISDLRQRGYVGAWAKGGFSDTPQLVVWEPTAITQFGDWRKAREGDKPGHLFRGNQFTDGTNSGGNANDDSRNDHRPSSGGPPLHDLTANDKIPSDIYEHPEYYTGCDENNMIKETLAAMRQARGNPNSVITIYRSAPRGVDQINAGDWITLSPAYAKQHGMDPEDPSKDWSILSMKVPASHVRFAGDDLMEWGYFPSNDTTKKESTTWRASVEASLGDDPLTEMDWRKIIDAMLDGERWVKANASA